LWVKWTLASGILGLAPFEAWFMSWLSPPLLPNLRNNPSLFQLEVVIVSVLAAFACALAQWAVLRPHIPYLDRNKWLTVAWGYLLSGVLYVASWIALAIVAVLCASLLYMSGITSVRARSPEFYTVLAITGCVAFVGAVAASAVIGLAQSIAFGRYMSHARRFVLSNVIAALIFQASTLLLAYAIGGETAVLGESLWPILAFGWFTTLFLSGTITGITLVRLLRQPIQTT